MTATNSVDVFDAYNRVRVGGPALAARNPDWFRIIDLDDLDTADGATCPAGQVFGPSAGQAVWSGPDGVAGGFNVGPLVYDDDYYGPDEYDVLTAAWRDYVLELRATDEVTS